MKADPPFRFFGNRRFWWDQHLANRIEDDLELMIIFLLQAIDLCGQFEWSELTLIS